VGFGFGLKLFERQQEWVEGKNIPMDCVAFDKEPGNDKMWGVCWAQGLLEDLGITGIDQGDQMRWCKNRQRLPKKSQLLNTAPPKKSATNLQKRAN